ncbi:MAG: GxxExxY protein [Planctomycetota bacterium]
MQPQINTDKHGNICVYLNKFKHGDISYQILNAAFEVHNALGCGFLEKVYENALIYELQLRGIKVTQQKDATVYYKSKTVGIYTADLIVENKVIIELKVAQEITKIHQAQLLNYLKATGCEVGLILNFAKPKLEYERMVK